jgi:hypothetical protein
MPVPKMSAMWDNYPVDDKAAVVTRVGGSILRNFNSDPNYNTCCIRTSLALNSSGAHISKHYCDQLKNKYVPPKVRASQGGDKLWYIASVYDMRVYLEHKYGHPKHFKRMSKDELAALNTGPGILMFFAPHCDLWDGSRLRYNNDEWTNTRVEQLLLWPCAHEDSSGKSAT